MISKRIIKYGAKNKFNGFTLPEILIAVALIAVLGSLTTSVVRGLNVSQDKIAIKKANQTIHDVVENMLNDGSAYVGQNDFSDISSVKLNVVGNGLASGHDKFSRVFYSKLKLVQNPFTTEIAPRCKALVSNSALITENCYESEDGILWVVPQTDFKTYNVFKLLRNGYEMTYVPVTVYVNYSKFRKSSEFVTNPEYFDKYAVVFGVRQDGDIRLISKVDCKDNANKKYYQCLANDIISEASF